MFVKLGQVLSTRADLLAHDFIAELSRLQDHVAPVDPPGIEALLTAEPSPRHQRILPRSCPRSRQQWRDLRMNSPSTS